MEILVERLASHSVTINDPRPGAGRYFSATRDPSDPATLQPCALVTTAGSHFQCCTCNAEYEFCSMRGLLHCVLAIARYCSMCSLLQYVLAIAVCAGYCRM